MSFGDKYIPTCGSLQAMHLCGNIWINLKKKSFVKVEKDKDLFCC
jgi:hypothetical protein